MREMLASDVRLDAVHLGAVRLGAVDQRPTAAWGNTVDVE